jgi:putative FmdB family regulatory protein
MISVRPGPSGWQKKWGEHCFMPVYEYQCVDCGELDLRVAALDDQTAICTGCGSLMLRLDEDVFRPYFENQEELKAADGLSEEGEGVAETRIGVHAHGKPVLLRAVAPRAAGANAATPPALFHKC